MQKLKRMIATLSTVAIVSTMVMSSAFAAYTDLTADWYKPAVQSMVDAGLLTGEGNFFPGKDLTRAVAAQWLVGGAGLTADMPAEPTFTDVSVDDEAYEAIETAVKHNVVNGYKNAEGELTGKFGPNDTITREQFAKMAVEAYDFPKSGDCDSLDFPDADEVSPWACEYMATAVKFGVLKGNKDGTLAPTRNINRAEGSIMVVRSIDAVAPVVEDPTCTDDQELVDHVCVDKVPEVVTGEGTLEISLNNDTPDSANIPALVENALVAKFDVEAKGADMKLTMLSIKREGLNSNGSVAKIALFDEEGNRVSKSKSFTSDTKIADVNLLNGGLMIAEGEVKTLSVYAEIGSTTYNGDTFFMSVVDADAVMSTAETVEGDFPVESNLMAIANVEAAKLEVKGDGTPADVKVGEQGVKILKFKFKNNDSDTDIAVSGITFKETGTISEDDELGNFELYVEGDLVATTAATNGKYVSFKFDDSLTVKSSKTLDAYVKADILGGAGKVISFTVDSDLDVVAEDLDYGFGAQIDATDLNGTTTDINVDAGELTVVAIDAENTDIRPDKDDVVLGTLRVTANAGQDLELQKFAVVVTASANNASDYFENVELYDGSSVYELQSTGAGASETFKDDDLSITLREGETKEFEIRADTTKGVDLNADGDIDDAGEQTAIDGKTFTVKLSDIGGASFYVVETDDDTAVTDITPSSVAFKDLKGTTAAATVTGVTQSATKNAVIGSTDVEALIFEVKAEDASDLTLDEVKVQGAITDDSDHDDDGAVDADYDGTDVFDKTRVVKLSLYEGSVSAENLLDTVSGSQIASEVATFEFSELEIAAKETKRFYVTVDIADDEKQDDDTIDMSLNSLSLQDDDSDDVTAQNAGADLSATNQLDSTRTITIQGTGSLSVTVDNADSATDQDKYVLGGTESDFVASYEFVALNEGVLVKDITITQTEGGVDLNDYVSEVVLYDNDKTTELARKSVTSDTVEFNDVNVTIEEGSQNIYVKVVASKMGKDQAGKQSADLKLKLEVTDAEGVDSGKTVANPAATSSSNAFATVPVYISDLKFVDSYNGVERATKLNAGENVLAIVAVTASENTNTDSVDGSALDLVLTEMNFDLTKLAGTGISTYKIERINGSQGIKTDGSDDESFDLLAAYGTDDDTDGAGALDAVDGIIQNDELGSDSKISAGDTAYYAIKATIAKDNTSDNDDYVKLAFDAFTGGEINYRSDDSSYSLIDANNTAVNADNAADINELRLDFSSLSGTQINE